MKICNLRKWKYANKVSVVSRIQITIHWQSLLLRGNMWLLFYNIKGKNFFIITGVIYEISYHWGHFSVQSESMNCKTHELAVRSFILVRIMISTRQGMLRKYQDRIHMWYNTLLFSIHSITHYEYCVWHTKAMQPRLLKKHSPSMKF